MACVLSVFVPYQVYKRIAGRYWLIMRDGPQMRPVYRLEQHRDNRADQPTEEFYLIWSQDNWHFSLSPNVEETKGDTEYASIVVAWAKDPYGNKYPSYAPVGLCIRAPLDKSKHVVPGLVTVSGQRFSELHCSGTEADAEENDDVGDMNPGARMDEDGAVAAVELADT